MSNTRRRDPSAPLSQERYMSSPEYAELRGISGNAVTAKAALMNHPAKRSLLFFLQAMSLREGGLKKFCREFLEMFSGRIGTPTMHRLGMAEGQKYKSADVDKIREELAPGSFIIDAMLEAQYVRGENGGWETAPPKPRVASEPCAAAVYVQLCRENLADLEKFIIELCVNPRLQFSAPGETEQSIQSERIALDESLPETSRTRPSFSSAGLPCFKNIIGALFEFKRHYEETARREYAMTEVGKLTFETLDIGLETGKMVLVEGNSGIGKTTATEAWAQMHLGEARLVSLSGITHKTGFFRAIAKVLGLASSYARTSTEMQTRIEDMLQRSRLVLLIDEAHHAFSAAERVYSRPELIDWINTALYNHGVPVSMICTPQFMIRAVRVEKQTSWNADQMRRRIKRFCVLPAKPRTLDLDAVARKLLPDGSKETIQLLVGYALSSKLNLPAIVDAVDMAKIISKREGRAKITFEDVNRAIVDYCATSSEAMARSFAPQLDKKRGRKPAPALPEAPPADSFRADAVPLHTTVRPGRKANLTGLAPVRRADQDLAAA